MQPSFMANRNIMWIYSLAFLLSSCPGGAFVSSTNQETFIDKGSSLFSHSNDDSPSISGQEQHRQKNRAIVIGGGPVGLATSMVLANAPHNYDVIVYESSSEQDLCSFNPALAYLYNVNFRGQALTKKFPDIHESLIESSVSSSETDFFLAPRNPTDSISQTKPPQMSGNEESYWIPRHEMVDLLRAATEKHNNRRAQEMKDAGKSSLGKIEFNSGMACLSISPAPSSDEGIDVVVKGGDGKEVTVKANLVVGADGQTSKVRDCLKSGSALFGSWDKFKAEKFQVKRWKSPSTALRLKAFQIPADFTIRDGDGSLKNIRNTGIIGIRGKKNGPHDYLSLGFLPMKENQVMRPANVVSRPGNVLWDLTTGEEARSWFEENFPRMAFQKQENGGIIPDEEWERFATAKGTSFPFCQYSPGLQASPKKGNCGVVLLGDSAHSFPPDIGQGINAGLADVVQFSETLKKHGHIGDALKEYERIHVPETRALIRIARFGAPYQYNQPHRIDRFRKKLWTLNIVLRLLLNKISFGLIPKAMVFDLSNPKFSYRQVARRADLTTVGLMGTLSYLLFKFLAPSLRSKIPFV